MSAFDPKPTLTLQSGFVRKQGIAMPRLYDLIPDVDTLLLLAPEELAQQLLYLAKENRQNSMVMLEFAVGALFDGPSNATGYPRERSRDIEIALAEAWNWLVVNSLLIAEPGINGRNGWFTFSRRAQEMSSEAEFRSYREAIGFPKSLLHPLIADQAWINLARGEFDTAVFVSFRSVEEVVREASGLAASDIGVPLMRKAFHHETGVLTDLSHPIAEREALSNLFVGAIGSYKNPHSHRTVAISDAREAQEMVTLASHLLRIVESRKGKRSQP
jgi:uncharacterized protein (TIGR02391 family)